MHHRVTQSFTEYFNSEAIIFVIQRNEVTKNPGNTDFMLPRFFTTFRMT